MSYRYVDSMSDVAFTACGETIEELFLECWNATLNVMAGNAGAIDKKIGKKIEITDRALDLLLFDFLQELIFYKDAERIFLCIDNVTIRRIDAENTLTAEAKGEEIDRAKHRVLVDVKAVTMHRFSLLHTDHSWRATIVLDV
jgi:SHS2 domain-containing protein